MVGRHLRRADRALVYAVLGTVTEVVFTATRAATRRSTRDARLEGHTYLWMPPIYASLAVLYEPLHDALRDRPLRQRAAVYAAGILAVEYASAMLIRRATGVIPWDYTGQSPLAVRGAIRLDYAPVWAAAGMALEHVDDALRSVQLGWTG
jgi:Putative ABC-transporter type IV